MMRSLFGGQLGIVGADRVGRDRKARSRRLQPSVDGLESRNLMSGSAGSISQVGGAIVLTLDAGSTNTASVSLQNGRYYCET